MNRWIVSLSLVVAPAMATAQYTVGPPLVGTQTAVNNGPGDQFDPHVSGDLVAYTNQATPSSSEIRYHNLQAATDNAIPNGGQIDYLSDINGTTVVFTRVGSNSAIFSFDVSTAGPAVELAPSGVSNRRGASVGTATIAWEDRGFTDTAYPEIVAYDRATGGTSRLTTNQLIDSNVAVSPDGASVVWTQCQPSNTGCTIWQAVRAGGTWTSTQLTGAEGEASHPDTNGTVVVYASVRTTATGPVSYIYWQPIGGGIEQQLAFQGTRPSISGNLIAFEHLDTSTTPAHRDIYVFDISTRTLYRITNGTVDETLTDISAPSTGPVRVVWTAAEADLNVYAFSFTLSPTTPPTGCTPEEPGNAFGEERNPNHHDQSELHQHCHDSTGELRTASSSDDVEEIDGSLGDVKDMGDARARVAAYLAAHPEVSQGSLTAAGCSSVPGGSLAAFVFVVALWLSLRRPAPVTVRRSHRNLDSRRS